MDSDDKELSEDMSEDFDEKNISSDDDAIQRLRGACSGLKIEQAKIGIIKGLIESAKDKNNIIQALSYLETDLWECQENADATRANDLIDAFIAGGNIPPATVSNPEAKRKRSDSPEREAKKARVNERYQDFKNTLPKNEVIAVPRELLEVEHYYLKLMNKSLLEENMPNIEISALLKFAEAQLRKSAYDRGNLALRLEMYTVLAKIKLPWNQIAELGDELIQKIPHEYLQNIITQVPNLYDPVLYLHNTLLKCQDRSLAAGQMDESLPPNETNGPKETNPGLLNWGEDSFINAILQTLLQIPEFENNIKILLEENFCNIHEIRPLLENMLDLFASMRGNSKEDGRYKPNGFWAHEFRNFLTCGPHPFVDQKFSNQEHDVHEFFNALLQVVFIDNSGGNLFAIPIRSVFTLGIDTIARLRAHGQFRHKFTSAEGVTSIMIAPAAHISHALDAYFQPAKVQLFNWPIAEEHEALDLPTVSCLSTSEATKNRPEFLKGENELFKWQGCINFSERGIYNVVANRKLGIQNNVPPIFIIYLPRFNGQLEKLDYEIEIPNKLNLNDFIDKRIDGYDDFKKYCLTAIIFHSGKKIDGGHYWTCSRDGNSRKWHMYDDQSVTPIDCYEFVAMAESGKCKNAKGEMGAACMVFYSLN